jgi:hypothetical protein
MLKVKRPRKKQKVCTVIPPWETMFPEYWALVCDALKTDRDKESFGSVCKLWRKTYKEDDYYKFKEFLLYPKKVNNRSSHWNLDFIFGWDLITLNVEIILSMPVLTKWGLECPYIKPDYERNLLLDEFVVNLYSGEPSKTTHIATIIDIDTFMQTIYGDGETDIYTMSVVMIENTKDLYYKDKLKPWGGSVTLIPFEGKIIFGDIRRRTLFHMRERRTRSSGGDFCIKLKQKLDRYNKLLKLW